MVDEADNAAQRVFWSGPSGQSWIAHEERQDALLATVAGFVVARAGLSRGIVCLIDHRLS